MFVQTIRAKVFDPKAVRAVVDRWMRELGPSATGWLGSTGGVTEAGDLFVAVRFDSADSAQANSDRPEQGQWWAELEAELDGEASFRDSSQVATDSTGDLDTAGFVQVILGRSRNPERSKELMYGDTVGRAEGRPDILGTMLVQYDEGEFAFVLYFTSEADAREGEKKEPPPEAKEVMEEITSLGLSMPEFLDLKDPWLDSPN